MTGEPLEPLATAALHRCVGLVAAAADLRLELEGALAPDPRVTELALTIHAAEAAERAWIADWLQGREVGR